MEYSYCYLAIHTDNPGRHADLAAVEAELGRRGLRASDDRPEVMGPFAYALYVGPLQAGAEASAALLPVVMGAGGRMSIGPADEAAWQAGRPLTGEG